MRVGLVSVGDELLAGDTVNTNAAWLGNRLTERGATVERCVVVPDRIETIAEVISELHDRYDAVLVTGGLGPTHDDLTMDAVARAFDRELEESDEAIEWLAEHGGYERADLAAGTADLPTGARVLHNEAGVAPGCVVESVYVFPGVPAEMHAMFETVAEEFTGTIAHVEWIRAAEPESALLDRIAAVRERFDVTVGSYPGEHVRLKVQSVDPEEATTAAAWLRDRVDVVESADEPSESGPN
ncbi:competence/damage-inducible protein A [Halococcus saccharolyticus]|uniref:Molybdopterin binding domain-containing protein n=1 Tax=Halococcus saccharolyticus DSM 5350 TaxID=1227455 RepID=M0MKV8_9EURY|nr:molybdopterin-binding protein [Halococcus saccharolyticus]EMA45055.1 molybdopterin binding domain-containing protein [Halococcus saccharolyticus DSM 5350]